MAAISMKHPPTTASFGGIPPGRCTCVVAFSRAVLIVVSLSAPFSASAASPDQGGKKKTFPKFSLFEPLVKAHFAGLPRYRAGDIISKSDVKPLFRVLKERGWKVVEQKEILQCIPDDNEYMVRQLRTKKGRAFMRDLSKYPEAYDRLDRFLRLPNSKKFFQGLLNGPGGYKLFKYMTSAKGGAVLGRQLSNTKQGRHFNDPTGRIYTAEGFLKRLKESHALSLKNFKEKQAHNNP